MRAAVPLLLIVAALSPAARAGDPAAALPPSTIAYLSIDVGRGVRELPGLELVELIEDEEVADFLDGAFAFAKRESRELRAGLKLLEMYGLPDIVEGRLVVALLGFGRTDPTGAIAWDAPLDPGAGVSAGDVVLLVETSGREAFGRSVERAFELIPEEGETTAVADARFPHRVTRFPSLAGVSPGLAHGFVGDTFVAALRPERFREVAAALAGDERPEGGLADAPAFSRWRAASTRGAGLVDLWFDLKALRATFAPDVARDPQIAALDRLGLDSVEGIGLSLGVADGRLRDSIALVTDGQRTGALALLDTVRGGGLVDEIPSGVDLAFATQIDLAAFSDGVGALLESIEPGARERWDARLSGLGGLLGVDVRNDLFAVLGERMAIWTTAKSGPIPMPDGGASIELRDGGRGAELLARLSERFGGGGVAMNPLSLDGTSAAYSVTGDLPVAPVVAVVGDRLVAATSGPLLRRRLAANGDGGLAEEDDFARCLRQNVGDAGDDVVGLLYLDFAHLTEIGLGVAGPYLPFVAMQAPFAVDPSLLPLPDTVSSYLSGYLLTVRKDDRVVSIDASSPFGGMLLSTTALALANWSIEKYEEKRARERARLLKPR